MIFDLLTDVIRDSILITGLVVVMMMMLECFNVESHGHMLGRLKGRRIGQVILSSFLGVIPGCMGGFASVSLYTHGMISFGALVAMLIASSGDEAFVMLAMFPGKAAWIFAILFVLAVCAGIVIDIFDKHDSSHTHEHCDGSYEIHEADNCEHPHEDDGHGHGRSFGLHRVLLFIGTAIFIAALATGWLGDEDETTAAGGINLLSEDWMNMLFAALSVVMLVILACASDHFVEEHLWHHIVAKHLPSIFAWTSGVLLLIGVCLRFIDLESWLSGNTALLVLAAALVGIIPESGPHLIFVTLYATGMAPLPVLLASCISQDGHASLPLLAESKSSYLRAKVINTLLALAAGYAAMLIC